MSPHLSEREREVLMWAAEGKTALETASILKVSASAVNLYAQRAMSKLQARYAGWMATTSATLSFHNDA